MEFKTLAELQAAYHGKQLYSDGAGRVAVWKHPIRVYQWYSFNTERGRWELSGSTLTLTSDAKPIGK